MAKKIICEYCGGKDSVKEILYGMPGEDTDFDKYIIGGCIPENVLARCTECGWEKTGNPELFDEAGRG
jgi:hypothetical protein